MPENLLIANSPCAHFHRGNFTRRIYENAHGWGLFVYALSQRKARKLLHRQSLTGRPTTADRAISGACGQRDSYRCFGVYPSIIGTRYNYLAGTRYRDSDRQDFDLSEIRVKAVTENIVYSTAMNLEYLIHGITTIGSQYPADSLPLFVDINGEEDLGLKGQIVK